MRKTDNRGEHLGWVEVALQAAHSDLPHLKIWGESHFGPWDRIAFVHVYGVDGDRDRRRRIRSEASDMLRRLGYTVELERGRDVYDLKSTRPVSAHDRLRMLQDLREACNPGD